MKFQKYGFTLAEILIVITLVGIIAALTIPRLNRHYQKEQAAASLAKTVNQIETGLADVIQIANNNSPESVFESLNVIKKRDINLKDASGDKITLNYLVPYMNMTKLNTGKEASYLGSIKKYDGTNAGLSASLQVNKISKGNAIVIFKNETQKNILKNLPSTELDNSYVETQVYVDINGMSAPNKYGKDIFSFFIQSNGKLKPYGKDPDTTCSDSSITDGLSCTARIVNEGYKISY